MFPRKCSGIRKECPATASQHSVSPTAKRQRRVLDSTSTGVISCNCTNDDDDGVTIFVLSEDLLLHIMTYIVDESGLVDGETLHQIQQVSSRFYMLSNSMSLWSAAKNNHPILQEEASFQLNQPSRGIIDQTLPDKISSSLVAFTKMEKIHYWGDSIGFKVKERATGKLFLVRISRESDVFYECQLAQRVILNNRSTSTTATTDHHHHQRLLLPIGWKKVSMTKIRYIRWYDFHTPLFQHDPINFITGGLGFSDSILLNESDNASFAKRSLKELLEGVLEYHLLTNESHGDISPAKIFVDENNHLKIAISGYPAKECSWNAPEFLCFGGSLDEEVVMAADVWSLGCAFLQILRHGAPLFQRGDQFFIQQLQSSESSMAEFLLDQIPPSFQTDDGRDLLKKMLDVWPQTRISASGALSHRFFHQERPRVDPFHQHNTIRVRRLMRTEVIPQSQQLLIRFKQWATIVDWILEVVHVFELPDESVFLAMTFFHQSICNQPRLLPRRFQFMVGGCLRVAALCTKEAIAPVDIAYSADNSFDHSSVDSAEDEILDCLNSRLYIPTILDFCQAFLDCLDHVSDKTRCMVRFVQDHALQSRCPLKYKASIVSGTILAVSFHCLHAPVWPEALQTVTGFSRADLQPCVTDLCRDVEIIQSTMPSLRIVQRRTLRQRLHYDIGEVSIPRLLVLQGDERRT